MVKPWDEWHHPKILLPGGLSAPTKTQLSNRSAIDLLSYYFLDYCILLFCHSVFFFLFNMELVTQ